MTHHSIMTYQERLATYIETLAQQNADMARGVGQEQLSANMTSLFATPFSPHSSPEKTAQQAALDSLGKAAGAAAQVIPNMMTVLQRIVLVCDGIKQDQAFFLGSTLASSSNLPIIPRLAEKE